MNWLLVITIIFTGHYKGGVAITQISATSEKHCKEIYQQYVDSKWKRVDVYGQCLDLGKGE